MASESRGIGWPARIAARFLVTIGLVWLLSDKLPQYVFIAGGIRAFIAIAALLTLMNLIVRPVLHVILAPFHFIFGIIATILLNWLFLYFTMQIASHFDQSIVTFAINGGIAGWLLIAIIIGFVNWVMKEMKL